MPVSSTLRRKILRISVIVLISLAGLTGLAAGTVFIFRNNILETALKRVQRKMDNTYKVTLTYQNAQFSGLSTVNLKGICLVPQGKDSLLYIDDINVDIRLFSLLEGKLLLQRLDIGHGRLNLVKDSLGYNFSSLLKGSGKRSNTSSQPDYAKKAYKLIRSLLEQIPDRMQVGSMHTRLVENGREFSINIKNTRLESEKLEAYIGVVDSAMTQQWKVSGDLDPDDMTCDVSVYSTTKQGITLPYLKRRLGLTTGFDTLHLALHKVDFDDELELDGQASMANFLVNHARLSDSNITVNRMGIDYRLTVSKNGFTLDSSSTITLNRIKLHPFLSISKPDTYQVALRLIPEQWDAQDFFESLPRGAFSSLEGIKVRGNMSYSLNFFADFKNLDALVFDSELKRDNFRIEHYGAAFLPKLNSDFSYTPYEYGRPMRTFTVGLENPAFTPLAEIPQNLQHCVLINEDPSFFYHRGFIEEAFRLAIAADIRCKCFRRGGSTISMQLVKNVFLSRKKTVLRKVEEALLVWLIENNRLVSKDRMFEVYLNIIEWAPNVYGIGEASRFYFDKSPQQLTLPECMFLSKLVPSPKAFRYRFNERGELKDYMASHFRFMAGRMVSRNWLAAEDTVGLPVKVELTGPARNYIVISDTSMLEEENVIDDMLPLPGTGDDMR